MEKMLEFGQDYVGSKILSENNSITYRLAVKGTNRSSISGPKISINDEDLTIVYQEGLNFVVLNPDNTIKEQKSFDVSNESMIPALKQYILALTNELVIIYSHNTLVSSKAFETLIFETGGIQWDNTLITRYPVTSYAAILRGDVKKIVLEGICYTNDDITDGDVDVDLEVVYDSFNDIGITGFPKPVIQDYKEYKSTKKELNKWPNKAGLAFKLKDYGLKPGDWVVLSGGVLGSKELSEEGGWVRIDCRWVTGSTWKESLFIESTLENEDTLVKPEVWEHKYVYGKIPETVDGFIVLASKQNVLDTSAALGSVKNVTLSVSAEPNDYKSSRQVSINGVRTNTFIQEDIKVSHEGSTYNSLLSLTDFSDETISTDFREY